MICAGVIHAVFATSSPDVVQTLLGVLGIGSIVVGGYVGFVKLRPDLNSAAISDAMEAAKGMKLLKDEMEADRDQWRERALLAERRLAEVMREH